MYAGLGLSAIVFIIHGLMIHGWEIQNHRMSLGWMGLMGALNLIGAAAYAARVGCSALLTDIF
jgi:adiponectin receptor